MEEPINLFEYEASAKARLPKSEYDFIAGGSADELTVKRNRAAFDSIMLRPRMLVDVGNRDLSTTVLGHKLSFPVIAGPSGGHARAHPEAELATVRAVGSAGILMVVSSASTYTMEEIAQDATGPIWFQQYLYKDQGLTREMAHRAEEAGYAAICITLDSKVRTKRERNIRNQYVTKLPANYARLDLEDNTWKSIPDGADALNQIWNSSAAWSDLEWIVHQTKLPIILKGIMTAEDARLAVEHGTRAVVVSNHGGRQLDTTLASMEVLPEVVEAVDSRVEVYLDGGIRRGTDVLKALALGARAVLIGRPVFWGLAVDGEAGVRAVLDILRDELDIAMAMCGTPTIESINASLLGLQSPLLSALTK